MPWHTWHVLSNSMPGVALRNVLIVVLALTSTALVGCGGPSRTATPRTATTLSLSQVLKLARKGLEATTTTVPTTTQPNEWVGPMKMSVQFAELLLDDVAPKPLRWREVVGGGAYVATSKDLITNFAVTGTTGATKVEVNTWYGADGHNEPLAAEQLGSDSLVCGEFSNSQTVQNWCRARIEATVATNSTSSKTVMVALDNGLYHVPYRFTVTTTKDALEIVDIVVQPVVGHPASA